MMKEWNVLNIEEGLYHFTRKLYSLRKNQQRNFGMSIGIFDGAWICELIEIYLPYKIGGLGNSEDTGLYKDDSILILKG